MPRPRRPLAPAAAALALLAAPLGARLGAQTGAHHGGARPAGHEAEAHAGAWPAMDAFHQTLHAAWHPAAERGDLRPARRQAPALVARAVAWGRTPAPAACSALPAGAVDSVATDARAFAAQARRPNNDARAMAALRALHARFEGVERACTGHGDAEHAGHGPPR